MVPHKLILNGFKRFKSASVLLDRNVLAFVGANEAGKSSFLEAILSLENEGMYDKNELTRGIELEQDDAVVRMEYLLEKDEKALVKKYGGQGNPRYYCRWKQVDGTLVHSITGSIVRNPEYRDSLIKTLEKFASLKGLSKLRSDTFEEIKVGDGYETRNLYDLAIYAMDDLRVVTDTIETELIEILGSIKEILEKPQWKLNKFERRHSDILIEEIERVLEQEETEHPRDVLLGIFSNKRPRAILFGGNERYLKGSYPISEVESPTAALSNLFSVADLEFEPLLNAMREDDRSEMLFLMTNANAKLKQEYDDSWSQSHVFPQLHIDRASVNLQIFSSGNYTEITRRSDGLKQYISLKAFLAKNESQSPLLLIDEAEIHLHYAAQSDLVEEFEKQNLVNSIIYTTHSAGCLPSDLGSGIRAVQPVEEGGLDTGISVFKNSIWHNNGGFSQILFAMGANIIAFTLARKAVIAEGTSETVLAPRLFRESVAVKNLDFQIAPGIASISEENASEFEFEAAKVVYLVDGDAGGKQNRSKLISGGISPQKIISLDGGCSIEDYVEPRHLLKAVNRELEKSGNDKLSLDLKKFPAVNRIGWLETQCSKEGVSFPSKVRVAENLASVNSTIQIIDKSKKVAFKTIHGLIDKALNK